MAQKKFTVVASETWLFEAARQMIILLFPYAEIKQGNRTLENHYFLEVNILKNNAQTNIEVLFTSPEEKLAENLEDKPLFYFPEKNRLVHAIKLAVYRVLRRAFGLDELPWGILGGVRPTKIVHRLLDMRLTREEIEHYLIYHLSVSEAKVKLLLDIVIRQKKFIPLEKELKRNVGIYIGIPFCPTRCLYCSFPSYSRDRFSSVVVPFLAALKKEIVFVGNMLKRLGLGVNMIYFGGGTPTTLTANELHEILQLLESELPLQNLREYTVEAGRPDTLDSQKLNLLKSFNVDRISINPQTMQDKTLKVIGRCHSSDDTRRAFEIAKSMGFKTVNMDLIAGLPGETFEDYEKSLTEVAKLAPENITLHTLSVKQASELRTTVETTVLSASDQVAKMLSFTDAFLANSSGMLPYYLYRQKRTIGSLENIGYTTPGHQSLYNILMIEEKQNIIGIGGGATTKVIHRDGTIKQLNHPKSIETYIEKVDTLLAHKEGLFEDWSGQ